MLLPLRSRTLFGSEFLPEPEQSSSVTPSVLGVQAKGQKLFLPESLPEFLPELLTPKVLQAWFRLGSGLVQALFRSSGSVQMNSVQVEKRSVKGGVQIQTRTELLPSLGPLRFKFG